MEYSVFRRELCFELPDMPEVQAVLPIKKMPHCRFLSTAVGISIL